MVYIIHELRFLCQAKTQSDAGLCFLVRWYSLWLAFQITEVIDDPF